MTKEEKKLKKLIEESERILVTTHASPDPDALASAILTYHALTKHMGKDNVEILVQSTWKYGASEVDWGYVQPVITLIKGNDEVDLEGYDLVILTDVDEIARAFEVEKDHAGSYSLVVIDHHPILKKCKDAADVFINDKLSSAAEQVYASFNSILGENWREDKYVSEISQYGIVSDTNRFMYEVTQPSTYRVMADLTEVNKVDLDEYTNRISRMSENSHLVFKECLENFRKTEDGGYTYITKSFIEINELSHKDFSTGTAAFFSNYILNLEDVDWVCMIKESLITKSRWGISLRSVSGGREVNKIAEKLGGGGHKNASGANLTAEDKDDAIQQVLSAI